MTHASLPVFLRLVRRWANEDCAFGSARRERMAIGLLTKNIKRIILCDAELPTMSAHCLFAWLVSRAIDDCAELRAMLIVRFMFFFKRLVDDRSLRFMPLWRQGSLAYFKSRGWLKKDTAEGRKECFHIMVMLCPLWGPVLLKRLGQRVHKGETDLKRFEWLLRLHLDPEIRGELSFEDVEALFCESKDALLTARNERHRDFTTACFEAFPLTRVPLEVTNGDLHALVEADLSPVHWHVTESVADADVDAYFENIAEQMKKRRAGLVQRLSNNHPRELNHSQ